MEKPPIEHGLSRALPSVKVSKWGQMSKNDLSISLMIGQVFATAKVTPNSVKLWKVPSCERKYKANFISGWAVAVEQLAEHWLPATEDLGSKLVAAILHKNCWKDENKDQETLVGAQLAKWSLPRTEVCSSKSSHWQNLLWTYLLLTVITDKGLELSIF